MTGTKVTEEELDALAERPELPDDLDGLANWLLYLADHLHRGNPPKAIIDDVFDTAFEAVTDALSDLVEDTRTPIDDYALGMFVRMRKPLRRRFRRKLLKQFG